MLYSQAQYITGEEYDSDSRKQQVQSTLECIKLDTFVSQIDLPSNSTAINKMVEMIEQITPQCPVISDLMRTKRVTLGV